MLASEDRTFALHEGGKVDVLAASRSRDRDDLSMAYTPGVARVCKAIEAEPVPGSTSSPSRRTPSPSSATAPRCWASATSGPRPPCRSWRARRCCSRSSPASTASPICLDTTDRRRDRRDRRRASPPPSAASTSRTSPRRPASRSRSGSRSSSTSRCSTTTSTAPPWSCLAALENALRIVDKKMTRPHGRHRRRRRRRRGHLQDPHGGRRPRDHRLPTARARSTRVATTSTWPSSGSPRTPTPSSAPGDLGETMPGGATCSSG